MDEMSRRSFLGLAGGVAVAAAGLPVLAACTQGSSGGGGVVGTAMLPRSLPFHGPTPDLPGTDAGVRRGYYSYPGSLVRSVQRVPGGGGEVTALAVLYNPPPPPVEQNAAWQEVNRRLGVDLRMTMAPDSDYQSKIATVTASGDLPDLVFVPGSPQTPPRLLDLLRTAFTDLGPFLAGDAVRAYPNLANIPTVTWRNGVLGGTLYCVPLHRPLLDHALFLRQDLLDQVGAGRPKSADDFLRLMKEMTKPEAGRWGITGSTDTFRRFFNEAFRVPNAWRQEPGGKLVRDVETDEHWAAVAYMRQLYQAGVIYPGSATIAAPQAKTLFNGGKVAAVTDGFTGFAGYWDQLGQTTPGARTSVLRPFGHDGGAPLVHLGGGGFGYGVAVKKASRSRVQELLRVMDFLAAPFGSQEYQLLNYGLEGVDFAFDGRGNPVKNARGTAELYAPWRYVAAGPQVLYDPYPWGRDFVRAAHDEEAALIPIGVHDPTLGLFSATDSQKSAALDQMVSDRVNDVIAGRAPLSSRSQVIADWRAQGGDQIRKEFEQALQQAAKRGGG